MNALCSHDAKSIQVQIEAYGAIRQYLESDLKFSCDINTSISEVLERIVQREPSVEHALERCACAIGEDIVSRTFRLQRDTHLVLLSPVAGG